MGQTDRCDETGCEFVCVDVCELTELDGSSADLGPGVRTALKDGGLILPQIQYTRWAFR